MNNIQKPTLDSLMNQLAEVNRDYNELSRSLNQLKGQKDALERDIECAMNDVGIRSAGNDALKISLSDEIVPTVTDWEALFQYIEREGAFYLLQKRMAAGAYREAHQMGLEIPGVEPFTKTKMSVRTA